MKKINITTIGGGNGQSNLLDALSERNFGNNFKINISSIVSMSDDGRTTGELMRLFSTQLDIHLPPTGDLRRCLFSLSKSEFKSYFKLVLEYTFLTEKNIGDLNIFELFLQANKEILFFGVKTDFKHDLEQFCSKNSGKIYDFLQKNAKKILKFKLPLNASLKGHKFGNILMSSIYYNFGSYDKMMDFMHEFLEVKGEVIPVTTKKAFIKAVLGNGEIIETQDRISNIADYKAGIADLLLSDDSLDAKSHEKVEKTIKEADFLVIGPGDLFTSIISNFIISGVPEIIKDSKAKIIYIGNNANKGGETNGMTQINFYTKIERFLGQKIDYFVVNNNKPVLSEEALADFKNNISVKGGDYLILSAGEKKIIEENGTKVIEADLLDVKSFYKHDKIKICNVLEKIILENNN